MADEDVALDEQGTDTAEVEGGEAGSKEKEAQEKLKEAINVDVENVGTLRKKLIITVPRETIDERTEEQFDELHRDAIVPGFRKGRAPMELVRKRYGSEVGDQLISQLVSSSILAACEKEEIDSLGDPLLWSTIPEEKVDEKGGKRTEKVDKLVDLQLALEHMKLPADGDLIFSCEVEEKPKFDLPDLEGIEVTRPQIEVSDKDVDSEIDRMLRVQGVFAPVDEGPIEEDDLIIADVTLNIDGVHVKWEQNVQLAARAQIIDGVPLPDFGKTVIGKKVGDEVTADGTMPPDHENLDWRGKKVEFMIKVSDIKRLEVPTLDDEMVMDLGFESEKELREDIKADLALYGEEQAKRDMRSQIGKYLINKTELEIPTGLSKRQANYLVNKRIIELYQMGIPEADIAKHADELRATAAKDAEEELKFLFITGKIAEEWEIEVGEEELNGAIAAIARRQDRRFDRVRDELARDGAMEMLYVRIRDDKIIDRLLEKAKIKDAETPKKDK
jgi:trigger factor